MDKLSIYELLSFVMPGALIIFFINNYLKYVMKHDEIMNVNNIGDSLILFCFSLLIGAVIHVITFVYFSKIKWYKNFFYKDISKIEFNDFTQKIIPFINEEYRTSNKHDALIIDEQIPAENLFDFAYFYLETDGKNGQGKNFQSIYFLFRNIVTSCIIALPILMIITLVLYLFNDDIEIFKHSVFSILLLIIILIILTMITPWFRRKMIDTVFGSYYSERIKKNNIN